PSRPRAGQPCKTLLVIGKHRLRHFAALFLSLPPVNLGVIIGESVNLEERRKSPELAKKFPPG
ncbi:MAG: hypothetical protein M0Z90_03215, partial [Desulfobacteraceae bacterium]|nr:hypothetical protein [Desulfobacteraceae bacterium]